MPLRRTRRQTVPADSRQWPWRAPEPGWVTLLRAQCRFPVAQEFKALLLIEIRDDLGAHRNRLHVRAQLLVQARRRVFRVDVVTNREELDVAADQLLTSLRKNVICPDLCGVGILRLLADEHHARKHERVVLGQYDAEVGIFLRTNERIRTQDVVTQ